MSWTVSTWAAAAALLALCRGRAAVPEGAWFSSSSSAAAAAAGYHVCARNESRNVSFLAVHKVPHVVAKPCDGWLAWKTCTVTLTQMVSRTEYRTEWRRVAGCCDGYEPAGRYCVLPANRSGEFVSKPGACPAACGTDGGPGDCESDADCPEWQKCCRANGPPRCVDAAGSSNDSENGGNRLNATVTVKTDYQQLMSASNGLLNHLRLLHSMVSGALGSEVTVRHLHSWPVPPYRTASSLLVQYHAPLSPQNVTWRLHLLLKHVAEVSAVTVQDVDECEHAALRRCSGGARCVNTVGSYRCACHPGYLDVDPGNPGVTCAAGDVGVATPTAEPPATSTPSPPTGVTPQRRPSCPPPSISTLWATNVTGASFSVCWSGRSQTNQTYLVVVMKGSETVISRETNETTMEVGRLQPGALYSVSVTPCTCGGRGAPRHLSVKTDARVLDATARLTNIQFTAELHNSSSQAYENLTRGIMEEIYQSLSPDMRALVDSDQLRIEIRGFSRGSVVVSFSIISAPMQNHHIDNVSNALLDSLKNSSTYTVDQNNTGISDVDECATRDHDCSQWATCTNTWASYSCACLDGYVDNNPERTGRACEAGVTMESTTLALRGSTSPRTQVTPRTSTPATNTAAIFSGTPKTVEGSTPVPATTPTVTAKTTGTTISISPVFSTTAQTTNTTLKPDNNTVPIFSETAQTTNTTLRPDNNTVPIFSETAQTTNTTLRPDNNTVPIFSETAQTTYTTLRPNDNTVPIFSTTAQKTNTTLRPDNNTVSIFSTTAQTTNTTLRPNDNTVSIFSTTAQTTNTTLRPNDNTVPIFSTTAQKTNTTLRPDNNTVPIFSTTAQTTTDPTISTTLPTNINYPSPTMKTIAATTVRTSTMAKNTISIATKTAPISVIASTSTLTTTSSTMTTAAPANRASTTTNNNNHANNIATNTVDLTTTSTTSTPETSSGTSTTTRAPATTGTLTTTSTGTLTTITSPVTFLTTGTPKTITAPATTPTAPAPSTPALSNLQGHLSVQCGVAAITVSIAKDFLLSADIPESALYLGSLGCGVNGGNGSYVQLTVAWNECDVQLAQNESSYTASVTLFNSMDSYVSAGGEVTTPRLRLEVPIMCTYMTNMLISANFGSTGYDMIQEGISGSGSFQVTVQLMNGSVPLPRNYSLSPAEAVVVEVSLNTSSEHIKLVISSCWATAAPDPGDVNSHTFLDNSCSQNQFTKVLSNGNSSTSSVSVQIFSVVKLNVIYLHCRVQVCLQIGADSCVPDCRQRTVRSGKIVGRSFGSIGPIFKTEEGSLDDELSLLQIVGFSCLGVGLSLFFIIGFVCLFFYQRNRIGHYNFSMKPKEENFTYLVFNT